MDHELVRVVEAVGTPICVSVEAGDRLYSVLAPRVRDHLPVRVSFAGVERLTTAFLNAGIGQLYNEFTEEDIRVSLQISDATDSNLRLLSRVIENAKRFFHDPERREMLMNEAIGDR